MPGEGSVYRSGGRWIAQLSVGPRNGRTLHRRYAPWNDNTKARARLLLAGMLLERRAADPRMTLSEYLPLWLARYVQRPRVGPSQAANAAGIVTLHLLPVLREVRLVDLRPSMVEAVIARTAKARSASTVRHVYNVLSVAIEDARREGLVAVNVVRDVPRPTVPKSRKPPWTLAELQRFLEACRGDRYEALYVVAAATGLRQGELLGLAWSDVDLDRATVTVALQLQRRAGRYVRVPLKSAGESHVIDLPSLAVEALRAHRQRAVLPLDDGLVFVTERGRPVSASVVTHGLGRIADAAGLPRRDFHSLRRFRASLGSALNIDPKVTQGQLGHANIATTLGIYTYTNAEQGKAAAALVDAALRRDVG